MKILYIHQYFKTPREPGATRIYFIVQQLLKEGHEVTVITQNKKITASDREEVYIDGINIVYLKNYNFLHNTYLKVFEFNDDRLIFSSCNGGSCLELRR